MVMNIELLLILFWLLLFLLMVPGLLLNRMPMTPFRVMVVLAGVAAVCLVFSAFSNSGSSPKLGAVFENVPDNTLKREAVFKTTGDSTFWKSFNFQETEIPQSVIDASKLATVQDNSINIMGVKTFYREAVPPKDVQSSGETVVLLHGAAFKSQTWLDLNTINMLAAMGHRVIAIDLPGKGNTRETLGNDDKSTYLGSLLAELKVGSPVLVSPSMSGSYSIPYIIQCPDCLIGFLPVAPANTESIVSKAEKIMIPTLVIYGEKDTSLGKTSRDNLCQLPLSQEIVIPGGSHPAYLDQPDLFHKLLYNFINQVVIHKTKA